jgi:hypothetical protein
MHSAEEFAKRFDLAYLPPIPQEKNIIGACSLTKEMLMNVSKGGK